MGDPVGLKSEARELVWSFREMSHLHGGWAVFYEVRPENLPLYLDLGMNLVKLGEEGRVALDNFSLEGSASKNFRRTISAVEREGCDFEVIPPAEVSGLLPEFKRVSDEWLKSKRTREKSFSLGSFNTSYLSQQPIAVVRRNGRVVAFANLWYSDLKDEFSIDLMRHADDAPISTMEYLFIKLMIWGQANGFAQFNLGMAPLSGLEDHALAPLWNQVGAMLFQHGEHFYNFRGLRQYKEKFHPVWEPRYLASPGGFALPMGFDTYRRIG